MADVRVLACGSLRHLPLDCLPAARVLPRRRPELTKPGSMPEGRGRPRLKLNAHRTGSASLFHVRVAKVQRLPPPRPRCAVLPSSGLRHSYVQLAVPTRYPTAARSFLRIFACQDRQTLSDQPADVNP